MGEFKYDIRLDRIGVEAFVGFAEIGLKSHNRVFALGHRKVLLRLVEAESVYFGTGYSLAVFGSAVNRVDMNRDK